MTEAWTECLGQSMDYRIWRVEHWKHNVSHLLTSPFSPLTSPEDHLHPVIESQDPPVWSCDDTRAIRSGLLSSAAEAYLGSFMWAVAVLGVLSLQTAVGA